MTTGELWKSGCDVLGLYANDALDLVKRVLQRRYFDLCKATDWQRLRRSVSLTFTGSETDGHYLPSDLVEILAVVDETSGQEQVYYPTEQSYRFRLDGKCHWFYPPVAVDPLQMSDNGLTISNGALTLTGVTVDGTGEFIRLDEEPGFYKIASYAAPTTTLESRYYGPDIQNKAFVLRPPETRKLVIVDENGDLAAGTVKVYYWQYPTPLYLKGDVPVMDSRVLELATWKDLVGPNQKRQTEARQYAADFEDAMSDALAKNPKFIMPNIPRSRTGRQIFFGRSR